MGPPSEDGGNISAADFELLHYGALQWGRRPRTAEIDIANGKENDHDTASMGPPSEDGGNNPGLLVVTGRTKGFNGAAVRGRRK